MDSVERHAESLLIKDMAYKSDASCEHEERIEGTDINEFVYLRDKFFILAECLQTVKALITCDITLHPFRYRQRVDFRTHIDYLSLFYKKNRKSWDKFSSC